MSKLYKRIDAVDEEEFGHDLVVMNTRTPVIGTFNGTARVMWDALADGASTRAGAVSTRCRSSMSSTMSSRRRCLPTAR